MLESASVLIQNPVWFDHLKTLPEYSGTANHTETLSSLSKPQEKQQQATLSEKLVSTTGDTTDIVTKVKSSLGKQPIAQAIPPQDQLGLNKDSKKKSDDKRNPETVEVTKPPPKHEKKETKIKSSEPSLSEIEVQMDFELENAESDSESSDDGFSMLSNDENDKMETKNKPEKKSSKDPVPVDESDSASEDDGGDDEIEPPKLNDDVPVIIEAAPVISNEPFISTRSHPVRERKATVTYMEEFVLNESSGEDNPVKTTKTTKKPTKRTQPAKITEPKKIEVDEIKSNPKSIKRSSSTKSSSAKTYPTLYQTLIKTPAESEIFGKDREKRVRFIKICNATLWDVSKICLMKRGTLTSIDENPGDADIDSGEAEEFFLRIFYDEFQKMTFNSDAFHKIVLVCWNYMKLDIHEIKKGKKVSLELTFSEPISIFEPSFDLKQTRKQMGSATGLNFAKKTVTIKNCSQKVADIAHACHHVIHIRKWMKYILKDKMLNSGGSNKFDNATKLFTAARTKALYQRLFTKWFNLALMCNIGGIFE